MFEDFDEHISYFNFKFYPKFKLTQSAAFPKYQNHSRKLDY